MIIREIKEVVESPIELFIHDYLHLTRENSKLMAACIEKVVEKYVSDRPQDQERERRTRVELDRMIHLCWGAGLDLEWNHQWKQKPRDGRGMRKPKKRKETSPADCFNKTCHRGNRCFFSHDTDSSSRTRRGRSTERRQSDYDRGRREPNRSRSKRVDRRRVIISDRRIIKLAEHE